MAKHLVDIDEEALRAARSALGTATIKDTVNHALQRVGGDGSLEVRQAFETLARAAIAAHEDVWR